MCARVCMRVCVCWGGWFWNEIFFCPFFINRQGESERARERERVSAGLGATERENSCFFRSLVGLPFFFFGCLGGRSGKEPIYLFSEISLGSPVPKTRHPIKNSSRPDFAYSLDRNLSIWQIVRRLFTAQAPCSWPPPAPPSQLPPRPARFLLHQSLPPPLPPSLFDAAIGCSANVSPCQIGGSFSLSLSLFRSFYFFFSSSGIGTGKPFEG